MLNLFSVDKFQLNDSFLAVILFVNMINVFAVSSNYCQFQTLTNLHNETLKNSVALTRFETKKK